MSENKKLVIKIHPLDNVLVALTDLKKDTTIIHQDQSYHLVEDIAAKHKFFITTLEKGGKVIMYGITVGKIKTDAVAIGQLMSTQNKIGRAHV